FPIPIPTMATRTASTCLPRCNSAEFPMDVLVVIAGDTKTGHRAHSAAPCPVLLRSAPCAVAGLLLGCRRRRGWGGRARRRGWRLPLRQLDQRQLVEAGDALELELLGEVARHPVLVAHIAQRRPLLLADV